MPELDVSDLDLFPARGDAVLITDASAEGEAIGSALRSRDFLVIDVPLSLLEARAIGESPRVIIVDVDQPGAIEAVERLRELQAGSAAELFCIGDPAKSGELGVDLSTGLAFERPVDIPRLCTAVASIAEPIRRDGRVRGTTPPPSYAPRRETARPIYRESEAPPPGPPSEFPIASSDPLDVESFLPSLEEGSTSGRVSSAQMSPELERILMAAEDRVSGIDQPISAPMEEDVDLLLPPELLVALDEPLEPEDDDGTGSGQAAAHLAGSRPTTNTTSAGKAPTTGARGATGPGSVGGATSPGTTGSQAGAQTNTGPRTAVGPEPAQERTPPPVDRAKTPAPGLTPVRSSAVQPPPSPRTADDPSAGGAAQRGARFADDAPPTQFEPSRNFPFRTPEPRFAEALPQQERGREAAREHAQQERAREADREPGQPERGREAIQLERGNPIAPPPFRDAADNALAGLPRASALGGPLRASGLTPYPGPMQGSGRLEGIGVAVRPGSLSLGGPMHSEPPPMPAVLGEGDALRAVARAISARASGSLALGTENAMRRIVLRDGDVVTAGSGAIDETLLSFLVERGDIEREAAVDLVGKLPPFGRHAGAALIAHGQLGQDDLWPVLRAHAEWIIARTVASDAGTCEIESEPPGRLKAEPNVFGGATGAEVLVEIARRVFTPEVALMRIGGAGTRLEEGSRASLLSECALGREEEEMLRGSRGRTVSEVLAQADHELANVLYALVALDVFEAIAPVSPSRSRAQQSDDPLDEEALRKRIRARVALVEDGDYFAMLGVSHAATGYEIKRAYLELRRTFEPARLLTAAIADLADDVRLVVDVLDEAYEILREPIRRERYRRAIDGSPP